jgi:hypothetical protein
VGCLFVVLDLLPNFAGVVLQLSPRRVEGVAEDNVNIFVGLVFGAGMIDQDALVRNIDVDVDPVELPFAVVAIGGGNCNPVSGNPGKRLLEFFYAFMDLCLDRIRAVHIQKIDL